jgi:hypothetical protein
VSTAVETAAEIRTFHVDVPDEKIDDLRRRIQATRWPSKELVDDRSQGVQLGALQALAALTEFLASHGEHATAHAGAAHPERSAHV